MELELSGQVAVVVGGASGIGRGIAAAFASEQAKVVLLDRDPRTSEVAAELGQGGSSPGFGIVADMTDYGAMQSAAAQVLSTFGRVDHVVIAAAIGSGKYGFPFWNLDSEDWQRVLQVNIVGAVNVAHAFTPHLVAARRGTILFISSISGQIGSQTDPPYSASKAALLNFAQCAAQDLAKYQVRVNSICPGMVRTPLNRSVWQAWQKQNPAEHLLTYDQWAEEKIARIAPLGRWQEVEDIAAMAVFLASPRAKNITGQAINVDGGQVMRF